MRTTNWSSWPASCAARQKPAGLRPKSSLEAELRPGTGGASRLRRGEAEQRREAERAARGVRDAPQAAMRGRVGLGLPGMRVRRATAGVQVMNEQCGHEHLAGGRFEDLDAEPVRAGVRRR